MRYARSITEPAATAMDWAAWSNLIQEASTVKRDGKHRYTTEQLAKMEENDVFSMSSDQLDQYLDFYLANFLDETHLQANGAVDDFQDAMYAMFPVTPETNTQSQVPFANQQYSRKLELVKAVHNTTKEAIVISDEDVMDDAGPLRPGARYVEYTKESVLPENARHFFAEAAKIAGLTVDMLIRCVRHIERKIVREQGRRKKGSSQQAEAVDEPSDTEEEGLVAIDDD